MAKGKARLSCGSPLIAIASARWISKLGALEAEATLYFSTAQSSRKRNLTFILHNKFTGEKKESIFVFQLEVLSKEKPGHTQHLQNKNTRQLQQIDKRLRDLLFLLFLI